MGLDAVELVMDLEERFNVSLPDSEFCRVHTVADLATLVIARLPKAEVVCPTSRAFFDLRRLFTERLGIERARIRPRVRLDALLPVGHRRLWRELRARDRRIPALVATERAEQILSDLPGVSVLVWLVATALMWGLFGATKAIPASICGLVLGALAFKYATERLRCHFPAGLETVGDMSRAIIPVHVPDGPPAERSLIEHQVLEEVRKLTAKACGMPVEKVLPQSIFVKDLGF